MSQHNRDAAAADAGANGATLLSVLLKRMASWAATAAMYLQRCHQAAQDGSASTAYMEGLDPSHHLNSIAEARQALQVHSMQGQHSRLCQSSLCVIFGSLLLVDGVIHWVAALHASRLYKTSIAM